MATYTMSFPTTKSSITVNYPDGLFAYIGDPRDFYRDDDLDQNDPMGGAYPDILLVPANGTFIDGTFNFQRTKIVWRRKRNETTFTISSQSSSTETLEIWDHLGGQKTGETIKILNPILYCGRSIEFTDNLRAYD